MLSGWKVISESKVSQTVVLECLRPVIKNICATDMYVVGEGTGHAKFCKVVICDGCMSGCVE